MRNLLKRGLAHASLVRALGRATGTRVVVLMYHDLRADDDFANWMRVPVSEFDAQLDWLGRVGRFIGPEAMAHPEDLEPGTLHFLLTFDDGYLNNLGLVRPLLARHRAPAVFFVTTEHMQSQRPFWPDIVVTAVQGAELAELDLRTWDLGVHRFRSGPTEGRWEDIEKLLVALKDRGNEDDPVVAAVLEHLGREHAAVLARHLPRFRPMTPAEVGELGEDPWCEIGSHSHRHVILTRLADAELDDNLRRSRRLLEDLCGREIRTLAYPNGDHDARVEAAVAAAGYERAYTVAPGAVTDAAAPLRTPRIGVDGVGPDWLLRYRLVRLLLGAAPGLPA